MDQENEWSTDTQDYKKTEEEVVSMLFTIDILTLIDKHETSLDMHRSFDDNEAIIKIPFDVEDRVRLMEEWWSQMGEYTKNSNIEWYNKHVYPNDGTTYPCRNASQYVHITDSLETVPIPKTEDELDCLHSSMELGEIYKISCVMFMEKEKRTCLEGLSAIESMDIEGRIEIFKDWLKEKEDTRYDELFDSAMYMTQCY